jgi:hypothetical protein
MTTPFTRVPGLSLLAAVVLIAAGCGGAATTTGDTTATEAATEAGTTDLEIPSDVSEADVIEQISSSCEQAAPESVDSAAYCSCYSEEIVKSIGVEGVAGIGLQIQQGDIPKDVQDDVEQAATMCIAKLGGK